MKKYIFAAVLTLIATGAFAQSAETKPEALPTVSITASGTDVKTVLHNMFSQAKKNYVVEPNTYYALNLILDNVDFEEALQIICKTTGLKYEVQNGIYFIGKNAGTHKAAQPIAPEKKIDEPKHSLPKSVLSKKLTTKLAKTDIRDVYAAFAKQAEITIEIDKSVPTYKLDVYLKATTLKYALENIKKATGLDYQFTDHDTIRIYKPTPESNSVAIANPTRTH